MEVGRGWGMKIASDAWTPSGGSGLQELPILVSGGYLFIIITRHKFITNQTILAARNFRNTSDN